MPDAVFIFLTPPDLDELQDRLVGRGTDSAEVLRNGLKAKEEIAMMREYDYAIVNDEVPLAAERVKRVDRSRTFPCRPCHWALSGYVTKNTNYCEEINN